MSWRKLGACILGAFALIVGYLYYNTSRSSSTQIKPTPRLPASQP